jgi:hypothetical protein
MPFKALRGDEPVYPEKIEDTDSELDCFDCDEIVKVRESHERQGSFVARHFWHPTGTPDGCDAVGGESWKHERMKSIAASKAKERWPTASVQLEKEVGERRADVLVVFDNFHHRHGNGVAIEAQHKHEGKDIGGTEAVFHRNRYSVLWLREDQYHGKDVDLDAGDWSVWWANTVPESTEWNGYHGIVHWLQQEQRPSVELDITLPSGIPDSLKPTIQQAWKRGHAQHKSRKAREEKWYDAFKKRVGKGRAYLALLTAPNSIDPYLVLSKGRKPNNDIIHVPVELSSQNATTLREFANEILCLQDEHGSYLDKTADDWETEVEMWFNTDSPRSKGGILKIQRVTDGRLGFKLKEVKESGSEYVMVANVNFNPDTAIKAFREIAYRMEQPRERLLE